MISRFAAVGFGRGLPQLPQNLNLAGFSLLHAGQVMDVKAFPHWTVSKNARAEKGSSELTDEAMAIAVL
jgi:hypothetical protein